MDLARFSVHGRDLKKQIANIHVAPIVSTKGTTRPGGITMQVKKYENGGLGGNGLDKAPWELTYSKLCALIGL